MMFPPSLLRVRVLDKDSRVSLWIPLVLVWPLVLAVYLLLLPCFVVAAIVTWRSGWGKPILLGGPTLFRLYCDLRGLRVDITEPGESVLIYFK